MNSKVENKLKGLRRMILSVPPAFAVFALLIASAYAGVPKSSGTYTISDDLAAGSAGSVDMVDVGGNIILSGSLGQVAVSAVGLGGVEVEGGYFSKYVSTPAALNYGTVYQSSTTVTGTAATYPNPSATLYELETSSAQDFSGAIIPVSSASWPVPLTGLTGNTSYYTRLRAVYMGEDPSPYATMSEFLTLPMLPVSSGFTSVYHSSLTVAWDGTLNSPQTLYYAQVGSDPGFTAGAYATTYASSYTFTSLSPNTTYFVRLKAIGFLGNETAYVLYGSTITTSVTPSTTVLCAISSTAITGYWSANGNPAGTRYLAQVSTDNFSTILASSQTLDASALFADLDPNTTHYLRVASLNASGAPSQFAALPDALTYAAQPVKNQADTFPSVGAFSVTVQWLANSNPPQTEYLAEVSTAADFSAAVEAGFGWASGVSVTADGLYPLTLYYFRAKARNAAGLETAYEDLGSTTTITGVDNSSPTITDNQAGDTNWRSSNTATYNIDLADFGGSFLDKLQVRATSGTAGTGALAFDWSDVVTNIDANSYTANWGLTPTLWGQLHSGTNYISVRACDGISNCGELADPFYILKDTAAPTIADNQAGEYDWLKTDPGAIYEVNFNDAEGGAGLAAVEYSASIIAGSPSGSWTAITVPAGLTSGATYYNGPWGLNFNALASGASNYISVRARDLAGNVTSLNDAFIVLKNVSGPAVGIIAPHNGPHSALAAVSGTAAPVLEYAISGTELTIQDNALNTYWNGSTFTVSQVWVKATGQTNWTYDTSGIAWTSGTEYQVVARSSDTALNYSIPYATATFTFDTSVPVAFISTPAAGAILETPAVISGTSQDSGPNSGVPYINLTLQRQVDLKWWNFFTGAWVANPVSTVTAGGAAWNLYADDALRGNLLNYGTYYVYATARDGATPPNESPAGLYASTFSVRDTVAPAAITVLSGTEGSLPGRLLLTWTATGDDGSSAYLSQGEFAINYSTWSGAVFSTAAAQVLISTAGVAPGAPQSNLIADLLPGVTYYLTIWTADEAGLWSGPSPLATARAGISLADSISGYVRLLSGQGVNAVIVEAIDRNLAIVNTVTTNDTGYFLLSGLDQGIYRVQATCVLNGFASSVASDQIPTGYAEVAFQLSVAYELASVGGELAAYRLSSLPAGGRYAAGGAPAVHVELYQRNRLVAVAPVGAGGRFLIKNLLPGSYMLKVPDGAGGYKQLQVTLAPGENLRLSPQGELLRTDKVYAFPNPARRAVTFHIESEQSPLLKQVVVFDITGRAIKEFADADFTPLPGGPPYIWEAAWNIPSGVASGVYIYSTRVKFEATGEHKKTIKKFAIVR